MGWIANLFKSQPQPQSQPAKQKRLSYHEFFVIHEQLPIVPLSGWTAASIMDALSNHDMGDFSASEQLYHAMMKEPRTGAAYETLVDQLRNLPFALKLPSNTPARIVKSAKLLERNYGQVFSDYDLSEAAQRVRFFGFCIGRHTLKIVDGQIIPSIKIWSHSSCRWNPADRLFYVTDEFGSEIPVQGDPWVIFSMGGDRPWLRGDIRKLAFIFFMLSHAYDRWAAYNDTEATSIRKIKVPALKREQDEVKKLWDVVAKLRGGDTMIAPEGYDLELLSAGGKGSYTTFEALINNLYNSISIVILGNNLTQEIKGGSLAAAKEGNQIAMRKIKSLVNILCEPQHQTTARIWVEKNFHPHIYGESSLTQYRYRPCYDIREPEDKKQIAEVAFTYSQSTKNFIDAAIAAGQDLTTIGIDWHEQAERCGNVLIESDEDSEGDYE